MPTRRRTGVFPLLVGVAVGILIAALTIPDGGRTTTVTAFGDDGEVFDDTFDDDGFTDGFDDSGDTGDGSSSTGGTSRSRRTRSSGSTAGGPAGGSTGDGGSGGGSAGSGGRAQVRGVTDNKIRIGVAIPDIGPFAVVDEFNLGDMRGHMESILDRWRDEGLVPVHGRDVEFVYRVFSIIGDEDVASCTSFVKDDQVFMVIGIRSYEAGAECLADRFDTPVITLEFVSPQGEGAYQRLHPWLFTLRASAERTAANFVHWAHRAGHLRGKTIGIYEEPDAGPTVATITKTLNSLGYQVAATSATNRKEASANDAVAVQRFQAAGVDLVFLQVSALAASGFMENANSQRYFPTYIDSDYGDHTSDAATTTHPASQYDETFAMTLTRVGEADANRTRNPVGEACIRTYEEYSGRTIDRGPPESAELMVLLQECDETAILMEGLQRAGRNLNRSSWVQAADTITDLTGAFHGTYAFGPQKHHGANTQRTIQWTSACECWQPRGPFGPLWL